MILLGFYSNRMNGVKTKVFFKYIGGNIMYMSYTNVGKSPIKPSDVSWKCS